MSLRRVRLQLEELGARTLPTATLLSVLSPSPAAHVAPASVANVANFAVSAPTTTVAGAGFRFTVTALDQFGNKVTSFTDTVHFSSSDGKAILPANVQLTNGTGTFSATLETAGNQTVSVTDTTKSTLHSTSGVINVTPAAVAKLAISAPTTTTTGQAFTFTVTALDRFGNQVTGIGGDVHFTSSDGMAVLPANARMAKDTATFSATLKTAGNQTIGVTDPFNAAIGGSSVSINVKAAPAPTGTAQGRYFLSPGPATQGEAIALAGTAQLGALGTFTVSGDLIGPARNTEAQPTGLLTFSNGSDSFTLQLIGLTQSWSSPLPSSYLYQVVKGTGLFQQLNSKGTIKITFTVSQGHAAFSLSF